MPKCHIPKVLLLLFVCFFSFLGWSFLPGNILPVTSCCLLSFLSAEPGLRPEGLTSHFKSCSEHSTSRLLCCVSCPSPQLLRCRCRFSKAHHPPSAWVKENGEAATWLCGVCLNHSLECSFQQFSGFVFCSAFGCPALSLFLLPAAPERAGRCESACFSLLSPLQTLGH